MHGERTVRRLLSLGVSSDMSRVSARRVRLLNRLTLVGLAFTCAGHVTQAEPLRPALLVHSAVTLVGTGKLGYDVWGAAVDAATAMEGRAEPGQIVVDAATWAADGIRLDEVVLG